jgi:hypothetical protein
MRGASANRSTTARALPLLAVLLRLPSTALWPSKPDPKCESVVVPSLLIVHVVSFVFFVVAPQGRDRGVTL